MNPLHAADNFQAIGALGTTVLRHHQLVYELAYREVADRYLSRSVGALWALINPLLLIGLYLTLFITVFPSRLGDGTNGWAAVVYVMSGLVPWITTAEILNRSVAVIPANGSLVKQIVFPIEVLPIKTVAASAVGLAVGLSIVLLIAILHAERPIMLVPLLLGAIILHAIMMVGIAFILATLGTFFRDLNELVAFFASAGLFIAPILYAPDRLAQLPGLLRGLIILNPFSHIVWCYQDALFGQSFGHPTSWLVSAVLAALLLAWGYRLFEKMKPVFAEAL